jgi:hypothetical protein
MLTGLMLYRLGYTPLFSPTHPMNPGNETFPNRISREPISRVRTVYSIFFCWQIFKKKKKLVMISILHLSRRHEAYVEDDKKSFIRQIKIRCSEKNTVKEGWQWRPVATPNFLCNQIHNLLWNISGHRDKVGAESRVRHLTWVFKAALLCPFYCLIQGRRMKIRRRSQTSKD